jgi:hypothetical protein
MNQKYLEDEMSVKESRELKSKTSQMNVLITDLSRAELRGVRENW